MKAFVLILLVCAARAQQPSPSFYVASIKLNHSTSNGMNGTIGIKQGGSISMINVPVRVLIEIAYELPDYRLSGGPAWISSTGYDVEAKPEKPVDSDTGRSMLQSLLAERFGLLIHHENALVTGFNLVVDKGGSKLQASEAAGIGFRIQGPDQIQGPGDMRMLTIVLKGLIQAPVEDHTGISGKYDIRMKWTRENGASSGPDAASEPSLSIFTAIKQQLGLSLEATKVPVDRVVIDRVERPTEN